MLRVLISMRMSIARGLAGKALPRSQVGGGAHCARWVCGSRSRSLRTDLASQTTETPAALRNCRGFRGKGGHDPRANGKGANRFAQLLYAPRLVAQSAHAAPTQSRYTCDGAVKWYLLLAQAMPRVSLMTGHLRTSPMTGCWGAGVTFIPFGAPVA